MADSFAPVTIQRPRPAHFALSHTYSRDLTSYKTYASHNLQDPVTHIDISPVEPYQVAASHGYTISLFALRGGQVRKSFSRFRSEVFSPSFKSDGRLIVAGTQSGMAKIITVDTGFPLRELRGHKDAVRTARFTLDGLRTITGSDDRTVRVWDVATGTSLFSLSDASDYVRCQNPSPASRHVWITGSDDGMARLYDLRSQACLFSLSHGHALSGVHILPGGAQAVTLGGPYLTVWDLLSGGRSLHVLEPHAKAVSAAVVDHERHRLLSAGLDGFVKFHDLSTFQHRGSLTARGQILDLAVAPRAIAVATAAGCVEFAAPRRVAETAAIALPPPRKVSEMEGYGRGFEPVHAQQEAPRGSTRYMLRGPNARAPKTALVAGLPIRSKLRNFDESLRKFRFREALDLALASNRPRIVYALLDELIVRGSLDQALARRSMHELVPTLKFIKRNMRKPAYSSRLLFTLNVLLDLYTSSIAENEDVIKLVKAILVNVRKEVALCYDLEVMKGSVESLTNASRSVV